MPFFPEAPLAAPVVAGPHFDEFRTAYRGTLAVIRQHIYLNHASVGPLSTWVIDAVNEYLDYQAMGDTLIQHGWFDGWRLARQRIGEVLGVPKDTICTLTSTSEAMMRAIDALPLERGDEALIPADDFPSVYYAMEGLRARGVKVVEAHSTGGDGIVRTDDLLNAITPRTRLLTASWINFMHGYRMDLLRIGEACADCNIWFLLDSIQGLGCLRLDPREFGIHFVAGQGAKWFGAPMGSGFLYVDEDVPHDLRPREMGWLGMELDHSDYTNRKVVPRTNANRFSVGTYTMPSQYGMRRACEVLLEAGLDNVERAALANAERLVQGAQAAGLRLYSDRSGLQSAIVTFELDGRTGLPEALARANVAHSVRSGRLRLSPHWYNSADEIDRVCDILVSTR